MIKIELIEQTEEDKLAEEERRQSIVDAYATKECDCCRTYSRFELREALDIGLEARVALIDFLGERAKLSQNPMLALYFAMKEIQAHSETDCMITGVAAFAKLPDRQIN